MPKRRAQATARLSISISHLFHPQKYTFSYARMEESN